MWSAVAPHLRVRAGRGAPGQVDGATAEGIPNRGNGVGEAEDLQLVALLDNRSSEIESRDRELGGEPRVESREPRELTTYNR